MPSQSTEPNADPLDNRFLRLFLFIVTFLLVPFLFFGVGMSFSDYSLILFFPAGLFAFFFRNAGALLYWLIAVGWILYVGISLVAVRVKKRAFFVVLYVIFLLLLVLNVAGCNLIVNSIRI